jgi:DNA-directed RNA polymerase subunit alpha
MWAWDHLKAPLAMSLDEHLAQVEKVAQFIVNGLTKELWDKPVEIKLVPPQPSWRDRDLDDLELSNRPYNVLKMSKYVTAGAIADATDAELLRLANFGRRSLNEVRVVIATAAKKEAL